MNRTCPQRTHSMDPYATFTSQRTDCINIGQEESMGVSIINDMSALASRVGNKTVAVAAKPDAVSSIERGYLIDTSLS